MNVKRVSTRRRFLQATATIAGAATITADHLFSQVGPKYTRYNVTSAGGKQALASYAKGIQAMMALPASDSRNWFRYAFIHLMDCPHGNWWFYVWHRAYLGYFEQIIRDLSGDATFAIPYWDWTILPQLPDSMFDGVLTPSDPSFSTYTRNLEVFATFIKPSLTSYWSGLNPAQLGQLKARGYTAFDNMWNDVTGLDPKQNVGIAGNIAWNNPDNARYLTRDNPMLDAKTAYNSSAFVVNSGLWPTEFYNASNSLSFSSSKTASHNAVPAGPSSFSVLEGFPHNKVHNYIGGVSRLDPGPYGYMTNFLSPVDASFFLHHANMDRLWDVWTRKQQALKKPWLPEGDDLKQFSGEPFLFFVDRNGAAARPATAGDYLNMSRFEYAYEPGFGEDAVPPTQSGPVPTSLTTMNGIVTGNTGSVSIPSNAIRTHLATAQRAVLIASVTLPVPSAMSSDREFDVVVGAPAGVTRVGADSPYYAGTISFFGKMVQMGGMTHDAVFAVPLPKAPQAFRALSAAPNTTVNIRVVPSQGQPEKVPAIRSLRVHML